MGNCSSCKLNRTSSGVFEEASLRPFTAKVIDLDGCLAEHPVPATASEVLKSSSSDSPCFLCSSDALFLDACIPALDPNQPLCAGQIYFVLPVSKLHRPLAVTDMAAMATRARSALSPPVTDDEEEDEEKLVGLGLWQRPRQGRRRRRIIPVRFVGEVDEATCKILNENSAASASVLLGKRKPTTTTGAASRRLLLDKYNKLSPIQEAGE